MLEQLAVRLGPIQRTHVNRHCDQVAEAAKRIAIGMKLSPMEVEHVRLAGLLHDVGKIMIPEELLAKPRSLTIQEWSAMGRHDRYRLWIAEALGAPREVLDHCRHHHTRFDAPVDDDNVTLGARILCVADALVTMTPRRNYQAAINAESAVSELCRERGGQFAPVVVDAVSMLESFNSRLAA